MNSNQLPDFESYRNMSDRDRKSIWKQGEKREAAIEKARLDALPPKSEDEKLLSQVEQRIASLKKSGMKTELFEREREQIQSRIQAHADREAREQSDAGQQTNAAFREYRAFMLQHGDVDAVVNFDAATEAYWRNGGDGDSQNPAWANAIQGYVKLRIEVENAAEEAARVAQESADMAQRQADAKQADANALKPQNEDTDGGEANG